MNKEQTKKTKKVTKKVQQPQPMILKIVEDYTKYVNVNRWFSYHGCNTFIIIGGRGIGKTTGLNVHNIKSFMSDGDEFLYTRRYITELKKTKTMLNPLVSGTKCVGLGHGLMQWENNGVRVGYGCALTAQQTFKSGTDFSKVKVMVYDEAILPPGGAYRYLPNEIEMLFELISTVFRTRTDYKVFIIGNNADMFNPYFAYFNIPKFENIYVDRKRGLYCELCKNSPALLEAEKETPLYKLTQGTNYAEYHYNNAVLNDSTGKIGVKSSFAKLVCRFVYNTVTINFYRQRWNQWFAELKDKPIKDDKSYILMENNKPNYLYITQLRKDDIAKLINVCYYNGYIYFDNPKCSAIFDLIMEVL